MNPPLVPSKLDARPQTEDEYSAHRQAPSNGRWSRLHMPDVPFANAVHNTRLLQAAVRATAKALRGVKAFAVRSSLPTKDMAAIRGDVEQWLATLERWDECTVKVLNPHEKREADE